MSEKANAEDIDAQAVEWVIRRDRAELGEQDQATLDAWLASDSRCRGAYARADAAWGFLGRARALPEPAVSVAPAEQQPSPRGRAIWRRSLVAAMAVAAGVAAFSLFNLTRPDYETAVGEVRSVPLVDGSVVAINTASRMKVSMEQDLRKVELDRGEAWFQVSPDATRPFVVEAGSVRVQALGTAFSVRLREGGADVLVTEGVVKAWVAGDEARSLRLGMGAKAFVGRTGRKAEVVQAPAAVERDLAWRNGRIDLKGETLEQAAAEFNRYNSQKLVIPEESLAREPVVGRFGLHEPESFAQAAASMFGARIVRNGDELQLVRDAAR